jgi:DNA topoisomerase 2-associated protein PAT1
MVGTLSYTFVLDVSHRFAWRQTMLDHLFQLLAPYFLDLFPSVRLSISPRTSTAAADQPVWQFLAALALHASTEQQQILVTSLREKVLQSVLTATKGWNGDQVIEEEERVGRLTNVNLFLHALGLDSSQITL